MTDLTVITKDKKFNCLECQNENIVEPGLTPGMVVECHHCGIEYNVEGEQEHEEYILNLLEEEK